MWLHHGIDFGRVEALGLGEPVASSGTPLHKAAVRELRRRGFDTTGPIRVAFLGQEIYFRAASCEGSSEAWDFRFMALQPSVTSLSDWDLLEQLNEFDPQVLVHFRPERQGHIARELGRRGFTIGVLTEPLAPSRWSPNRDLRARRQNYMAAKTLSTDWMVCAVPHFTDALQSILKVDVTSPLPVHDAIFRHGPLPVPDPWTGLFVGHVTPRRRNFLADLKHRYSWTVVDHGTQWFDPSPFSVGVNIHAGDYANHEHRVFCHMANGQVLLDEPTRYAFGLFPGTHRLIFTSPQSLLALVQAIQSDPSLARRVQIRARRGVENFRASRVWPRIVLNALARRGAYA